MIHNVREVKAAGSFTHVRAVTTLSHSQQRQVSHPGLQTRDARNAIRASRERKRQPRLVGADKREPLPLGESRIGNGSSRRAHAPIKGKLTDKEQLGKALMWNLASGGKHGHGNWEVEGGARLSNLRRSKVHRHVKPGNLIAARLHGAAHPRSRLEDRGVRHAHNGEPRDSPRDAHLDRHGHRFHSPERCRWDAHIRAAHQSSQL